jgi:magnesium transporter
MTVSSLRQANISVEQTQVGLRQNSTIQRLTILATIFLPLTFISGFFGQVFAWHIQHFPTYTEFIVYGLAVVVVSLVVLVWWLRAPTPRAKQGDITRL